MYKIVYLDNKNQEIGSFLSTKYIHEIRSALLVEGFMPIEADSSERNYKHMMNGSAVRIEDVRSEVADNQFIQDAITTSL